LRRTKLILTEGIPGSGKSTTAQLVARQLAKGGIPHRWWYEEECRHPVYTFQDREGLRRVVADLTSGNYRAVVAAALEQWRRFSEMVQRSGEVAIIDGCLFGYLTWSLFPLDVPEAEIRDYVWQVEAIIRPNNPCLIYFYQADVAGALRRICDRRGGDTEQGFIYRATDNPYGRRKGLAGFDGMAAYWTDYRAITDREFDAADFHKLAIENGAGDWLAYYRQILEFLDLPDLPDVSIAAEHLERLVGTYRSVDDAVTRRCIVRFEGERLVVDGVPQAWPSSPIVPESPLIFAVESLPTHITLTEDASGDIDRMFVSGPDLLNGVVDAVFVKE